MWYNFGELLKLDTTDLDSIDQQSKHDDSKVLKKFELRLSTCCNAIRKYTAQSSHQCKYICSEIYKGFGGIRVIVTSI